MPPLHALLTFLRDLTASRGGESTSMIGKDRELEPFLTVEEMLNRITAWRVSDIRARLRKQGGE